VPFRHQTEITMAKINDVFDYLNVADKEDIYTGLIHVAFNESTAFRQRFCAFFGAKVDEKAKLLLRNPFLYETTITTRKINKDGRIAEEPRRHKRQIPDLTLITQDKICIIESKLFASEGSYQTERYGDIRFLKSIKKDKKLASLDLTNTKLHSHRCKTIDDQCLFYMTINGDRAYNDAFMSITWSDLIASVFTELYDHNEILIPILTQMKARFESYPIVRNDIIAKKSELDLDAFLRQSAKHFLLNKDFLLLAYFDELKAIRESFEHRESMRLECVTILGSRQLIISDQAWEDPSIEAVLQSVPLGTQVNDLLDKLIDEPYPFSKLVIKVINNRKISVCVNYEPNPYLSEAKLIKKYGSALVERLKEGKALFEKSLSDKGITPSSTLLQVAKTEFSKKDKELVDKVIAQIKQYIIVLDELTQKEPRYE
jgi:hypothetical protein